MEPITDRVKKIIVDQLGVEEDLVTPEVVLCRRPGRGQPRHCRAGDGPRGGVRDRDPRRSGREDHAGEGGVAYIETNADKAKK